MTTTPTNPDVTMAASTTPAELPELPRCYEFVYEFAGGNRKLDADRYNGGVCTSARQVYTADQMREYGRACRATQAAERVAVSGAGLSEEDAALLLQAATLLEDFEIEQEARGNGSAAAGAGCSAHAVRRLAAMLPSATPPQQATPAASTIAAARGGARAEFESWLKTKPEALYWNASDAMLAAWVASRKLSEAAQPDLPPLPAPCLTYANHIYPAYSKKQMEEFARAALATRGATSPKETP